MWHIIAMGAGKRFSAHVPAGDDPSPAICDALAASEEFVGAARIDERTGTRLQVVVEELVTNAFRHGAATVLTLTLAPAGQGVELSMEDDGIAFDPTAPTVFAGPDAETGGGVGLALIRAWSSRWTYVREGDRNRSELLLAVTA